MNEGSGVFIARGNARRQFLKKRDRQIASERCVAPKCGYVVSVGFRCLLERRKNACGRLPRGDQRACKREFEIEHSLQRASIRKKLAHCLGREERIEQARGRFVGQRARFLSWSELHF